MKGLSSKSLEHLHRILRTFEYFGSDSKLRSLFIDDRISAWQDQVPESNTPQTRIDSVIAFLWDQHDSNGENGLVLFLDVLIDKVESLDGRHGDLRQLRRIVEAGTSVSELGGLDRIYREARLEASEMIDKAKYKLASLNEQGLGFVSIVVIVLLILADPTRVILPAIVLFTLAFGAGGGGCVVIAARILVSEYQDYRDGTSELDDFLTIFRPILYLLTIGLFALFVAPLALGFAFLSLFKNKQIASEKSPDEQITSEKLPDQDSG